MPERPSSLTAFAQRALSVLVFFAVATPLSIAFQTPPQPAFYNQWLSLALWWVAACVGVIALRPRWRPWATRAGWRTPATQLAALWLVFASAIALHVLTRITPGFVALPALAALLTAAFWCMIVSQASSEQQTRLFIAMCAGLVVAAALNLGVAAVQFLTPTVFNDAWLARAQGERPFGNLRQPNLFALLVVWGALAAIWLTRERPWRRMAQALIGALALAALAISESRAGWLAAVVVTMFLLALRWIDSAAEPLARSRRRYAVGAAAAFAMLLVVAFFGFVLTQSPERANDGDVRALSVVQRFMLWQNALELIRSHPLVGVGFGQLAFAWLLTPLSPRAADLFDHAHNAPLHLAAEMGLPFAVLFLAALAVIAWRALRASGSSWRFASAALLLAIGVQSLFEYPLWFAHFFLPSAAIFALLCASAAHRAEPASASPHTRAKRAAAAPKIAATPGPRVALLFASGMLALGASALLWALMGYRMVAAIYVNADDTRVTLRLAERASEHYLYGYYGDYAQIMLRGDTASPSLFARPVRAALDDRLLTLWAHSFLRQGDSARARHLIERAAESPALIDVLRLPILPAAHASNAALRPRDFR